METEWKELLTEGHNRLAVPMKDSISEKVFKFAKAFWIGPLIFMEMETQQGRSLMLFAKSIIIKSFLRINPKKPD